MSPGARRSGAARGSRRRRRAQARGRAGEAAAAWMLRLKGYRIIGRRVRTPLGEIDIIARRRGVTAFVEVKTRAGLAAALAALSPRQRQRMEAAARWWLGRHGEALRGACRFDLVAVNRWLWPRHVVNAFGADGGRGAT